MNKKNDFHKIYNYSNVFKEKNINTIFNILDKKNKEDLQEIFSISFFVKKIEIINYLLDHKKFNPFLNQSNIYKILNYSNKELLDKYIKDVRFSIENYQKLAEYSLSNSTFEIFHFFIEHYKFKNVTLNYEKLFLLACKKGKIKFLSFYFKDLKLKENIIYKGISLCIENNKISTLRFILSNCTINTHFKNNELFIESLKSKNDKVLKCLFDYNYNNDNSLNILLFYLEHFEYEHDDSNVRKVLNVMQKSKNFRNGLPKILAENINYSGLETLYDLKNNINLIFNINNF